MHPDRSAEATSLVTAAKNEERSELDEAMLSVWRQALIEPARRVQLGLTPTLCGGPPSAVRQVYFEVAG